MALKLSTATRNKLCDTGSLSAIFNLGFIKFYSGTVPSDADSAVTGTLLNTYSNNATGTGLTFDPAVGGALPKKAAEVWSGNSVAAGTATYYRLVAVGDTGGLSTTQARIQGAIGLSGAELNLATIALLNATLYQIDNFSIGIPTL